MKKQSLRIFLMFGLLAIVAVSSVHAQSNNQTANIPFSFSVAGKTFPAGEYRVTRVNPQSSQAALTITSTDGRMSKVVLTNDIQAASAPLKAKLVFNQYGDQYFLAQVWTGADNTGLALPRSRAERTLARNLSNEKPERQVVALNSRRH